MTSLYTIFHGNLAFSAVETESLPEVIDRCYFPLLQLIEQTEIKIGLEVSAFSLEVINKHRPKWLEQFKTLHKKGLIELVGSGYMQIIGPLVPYEVNLKNQQLGLEVYQQLLGITPQIAYVNEQAFSVSMVDLYQEVGYQAIAMEWNNAFSKHKDWLKSYSYQPAICEGIDSKLPIIWTDSIIFQKFQRHIHGEMGLTDYLTKIKHYLDLGYQALPIYTSDLEVFNYRPGRFETEAQIANNEWERMQACFIALNKIYPFNLPSEVLNTNNNPQTLTLTTADTPILVKKQGKYSLSRWAACGRGATKINKLCYQYWRQLEHQNNTHVENWKNLLTYWGSDFRTHITPQKWQQAMHFFKKNIIYKQPSNTEGEATQLFSVEQGKQRVSVYSDDIQCHFLTFKGLCLDSIIFKGKQLAVGTVHHGDFDYIHHGADYYTGTTVIDSAEFGRVADLAQVKQLSITEIDNKLILQAKIPLKKIGFINKSWIIDALENTLSFQATIKLKQHIKGSIRTGTLTLIPQPNHQRLWYECKNGGAKVERYFIDNQRNIAHHQAQSLIQSSQGGLGVTDGCLKIGDEQQTLCTLHINQSESYPFVMLENAVDNDLFLTRVYFSMQEIDDTLKEHQQTEFKLSYCIPLRSES